MNGGACYVNEITVRKSFVIWNEGFEIVFVFGILKTSEISFTSRE